MRLSKTLMALAVLVGGATLARADETGIAGIHDWHRVGDRICFVDHYHDGAGHGSSQKAALAEAIKSWQDFTDLEYGSDWASFSKAAAKSTPCTSSGGGFECSVHAIPCKSAGVAASNHRVARRHRE